jgi:phage repressor protein C with HTH and peptisase S24 domain
MKERLIEFLTYLGIGQSQFEKKCGLSNGFVDKVGDSIRTNNLNKISAIYPELNINWLKTGEGSMLKSSLKSQQYFGEEQSKYKTVPLLPIDAVAGFPSEDVMGVKYADCEQYRVPEFEISGCEFIIRVSGSSMYPKYSNGDLLACKKIPAITFFQWGKVYVLDTVQGALVKRLFEDKENPDNIICQSDNKENYPAFSLPKDAIRSLSIVLGVIRME